MNIEHHATNEDIMNITKRSKIEWDNEEFEYTLSFPIGFGEVAFAVDAAITGLEEKTPTEDSVRIALAIGVGHLEEYANKEARRLTDELFLAVGME